MDAQSGHKKSSQDYLRVYSWRALPCLGREKANRIQRGSTRRANTLLLIDNGRKLVVGHNGLTAEKVISLIIIAYVDIKCIENEPPVIDYRDRRDNRIITACNYDTHCHLTVTYPCSYRAVLKSPFQKFD